MAMGEQLRGLMRKAKQYWSELTDEDSSSSQRARRQSRSEEQEDAVHQRYGGVRTQGERDLGVEDDGFRDAEAAYRDRQENSQDRGPADAILANPAARAGLGRAGQGGQLGGQEMNRQPHAGGQQQMQNQTGRQYTQQGGSGIQKTLGEQMSQQDDSSRLNNLELDEPADAQRQNQGGDLNRQRR